MSLELIYQQGRGLRSQQRFSGSFPIGTYYRDWHGVWRLRCKRRTAGKCWKRITEDLLPKAIKVEMLLLGVT